MKLIEILAALRQGNLSVAYECRNYVNFMAMEILAGRVADLTELENLMRICNIVYNNTDREIMVVEDGVYDLLQEMYKRSFPDNYQVGAEIIQFDNVNEVKSQTLNMISPFRFLTEEEKKFEDNMFFKDILFNGYKPTHQDLFINPFEIREVHRRMECTMDTKYPDLVGTLDKCKFVLDAEAKELGVYDDPNVAVLERDFFKPLIESGDIDPNAQYDMDIELKYDGVSVAATCANYVIDAGSRGDTEVGMSSDLTDVLAGYYFPYASELINDRLGIQFEAIMSYPALIKFNQMKGYAYKNCRSAIVGMVTSRDAYKYRDLITLVPIRMQNLEPGVLNDREIEIDFLNKYYVTGEPLRSAKIRGNYRELLLQIHKYAKEAEYSRAFIPFMYDGIVVSFLDPELRERLGRKNSVNKYSMAVKFMPLTKQTTFLGYTYEVGQDASITPMIHYNPVEFYGTVHPKSTGHSYDRFMTLGLIPGDILDVTYVNDVMPYVKRAENSFNDEQRMKFKPIPFPTKCPACHGEVLLSPSGKSAFCTNPDCIGVKQARIENMVKKIGFRNIAEESLKKLKVYTFRDFMSLTPKPMRDAGLGEALIKDIQDQIKRYKKNDTVKDYEYLGALGFKGISNAKWKIILTAIHFNDLFLSSEDVVELSENIRMKLPTIKGIGKVIADTIADSLMYFYPDIMYIAKNMHICFSYGVLSIYSQQVRFTGVRDKELVDKLSSEGYDIGEGGVTRVTTILLVPFEDYSNDKTIKAAKIGAKIIPIKDFRADPYYYLDDTSGHLPIDYEYCKEISKVCNKEEES